MVYLKSLLTGVIALLCAIGFMFVLFIGISMFVLRKYAEQSSSGLDESSIAWDPVSLRHPLLWIVLLAAFVGGFIWQYRRLALPSGR